MIEISKAIDLLCEINRLDLEGGDFLAQFGIGTIAREYNGIGPEYFKPKVRALVTKHLSLFQPAAVIHDMENFMSDGSEEKFHAANRRFLTNCQRLADDKYGGSFEWLHPIRGLKRYRAHAAAQIMYEFVDSQFGWQAWMDCYDKNKQQQKGTNR